ncbi:manganese-dependent inorganic pyrophosphatase [bacterium DOLZORAL124_38_8]|nr:MAG: manganese-dependent inorganic pyrophosphatase [bacterium DOLZORAL124_38_8]
MTSLKVFGHRSPDTDATAAAILWAWYLSEQGTPATPYVLGNINTETKFVLDYWKFDVPALLSTVSSEDSVVIVDTNNPKELFENINETQIKQIIDHHKLVGGIETSAPIDITIRPLASTASVIYELLGAEAVSQLPNPMAGLMLSCILSDTLGFRSPTTTDADRHMAQHLAQKLGIDMEDYANQMFAAKSDVSAFSAVELVKMDSKKYEIGGKNYRISVLETTTPKVVLDRKSELVSEMEMIKGEESLDEVLLFVIDIFNQEATLLVPNEGVKTVAETSFGVTVDSDTVVLPGIVSRKKQIIPALS